MGQGAGPWPEVPVSDGTRRDSSVVESQCGGNRSGTASWVSGPSWLQDPPPCNGRLNRRVGWAMHRQGDVPPSQLPDFSGPDPTSWLGHSAASRPTPASAPIVSAEADVILAQQPTLACTRTAGAGLLQAGCTMPPRGPLAPSPGAPQPGSSTLPRLTGADPPLALRIPCPVSAQASRCTANVAGTSRRVQPQPHGRWSSSPVTKHRRANLPIGQRCRRSWHAGPVACDPEPGALYSAPQPLEPVPVPGETQANPTPGTEVMVHDARVLSSGKFSTAPVVRAASAAGRNGVAPSRNPGHARTPWKMLQEWEPGLTAPRRRWTVVLQ